jgi:FkbM family methyltransferase
VKERKQYLLYILRQYSFGELILLATALATDFVWHKLPVYLLRTRRSFSRYRSLGIATRREKEHTVLSFGGQQIYLRRDSSDFMVFDQIMLEEEFKPFVQLIAEEGIVIRNIIDCGANIGLTLLYFSRKFQGCNVLALEPEPENFRQLSRNIKANNLERVRPVQIGVWSKKALLEHDVSFCHAKDWAFSVRESSQGAGSIAVDTLDNIMIEHDFPEVDYIKMDVEGSEFELFRNLGSWNRALSKAKVISIEVHEKKGPMTEIEDLLIAAGFKVKRFGELLVGTRT